ncbi:MAG: hypothetical protein AB2541_13950, partial [Candidatus Thiodiazotropha sp.]
MMKNTQSVSNEQSTIELLAQSNQLINNPHSTGQSDLLCDINSNREQYGPSISGNGTNVHDRNTQCGPNLPMVIPQAAPAFTHMGQMGQYPNMNVLQDQSSVNSLLLGLLNKMDAKLQNIEGQLEHQNRRWQSMEGQLENINKRIDTTDLQIASINSWK